MKSSGLFSEHRSSFFVTVTVSASLLRPLTSMKLVELAVGRLEAETALGLHHDGARPRGGELGVVRPPGTRRRPAGHLVDQAPRDDQQAAEHHRRPQRDLLGGAVLHGRLGLVDQREPGSADFREMLRDDVADGVRLRRLLQIPADPGALSPSASGR